MFETTILAPTPRRSKREMARIQQHVLPPPIGGWNARDALPNMPETDALVLDNWVPGTNGVVTRGGTSLWVDGLANPATVVTPEDPNKGQPVETLMPYSPPNDNSKLFAATADHIWDITDGIGVSVLGGLLNARWSYTSFGSAATHVLYICNGMDIPRYYDGTGWETSGFVPAPGYTLNISDLDFVHAHMNRLWFVEKNSLTLWYSDIASIGPPGSSAPLYRFSLSSLFRRGGKIVAINSWTRDGGAGPDDNLVIITSNGQVAIYAGTSPVSTATSALVGVYKIAEPVGRRCLLGIGADLAVITNYGFVPLSKVLPLGETAGMEIALTDKVAGAFMSASSNGGGMFGWQAIEYPSRHLVVINVPIAEGREQQQYILNTHTGAWSRWKDLNASCWVIFNEFLYMGTNDGRVLKYDPSMTTDYKFEQNPSLPPTDPYNVINYKPIITAMASAFSVFGTRRRKGFRKVRPIFFSPKFDRPARVQLRMDYDLSVPTLKPGYVKSQGHQWAVDGAPIDSHWQWAAEDDNWDTPGVCLWASGPTSTLEWQGVEGEGVAAAAVFGFSTETEVIYNGLDVTFEIGGVP